MPAALILCFARTSRCAIVASGNEEGARDLDSREPAQRAQRERDLRLGGERRMAAREQQLEPLVGKCRLVHAVLRCLRAPPAGAVFAARRAIAANAVDGPVARRGHEPGARAGGDSVARPALRGDRERLLRGFLGEVEIAEEADQGSEDASPTARGRPARGSLPLLDRTHLDGAAHARGRDARGQRERGVEVVGLEVESSRRSPP